MASSMIFSKAMKIFSVINLKALSLYLKLTSIQGPINLILCLSQKKKWAEAFSILMLLIQANNFRFSSMKKRMDWSINLEMGNILILEFTFHLIILPPDNLSHGINMGKEWIKLSMLLLACISCQIVAKLTQLMISLQLQLLKVSITKEQFSHQNQLF